MAMYSLPHPGMQHPGVLRPFSREAVELGEENRDEKTEPLTVMAHLKKGVVELVAEENSLANALVISVPIMMNDRNYTAYRGCRKKILPKVCSL